MKKQEFFFKKIFFVKGQKNILDFAGLYVPCWN